MNWHRALVSGIVAAVLTLTLAPPVAADPPPWAGVWRHDGRFDRRYDDDRGWRGTRRGYGECASLLDRMDHDRDLIAQWEHTGRHQKVVQWAREDIANARRDLYECRSGGPYRSSPYGDGADCGPSAWGYGTDSGYDPYDPYGRYGPYDPRDGFDWNRDWPLLLGALIDGQLGH